MRKMTSNVKLMEAMIKIFETRGGTAVENVKKGIPLNFKGQDSISQALRHFSKVTLRNALPVFPGLISISSEAVGGNPEITTPFGEAIVMFTGAADLHDDVVDQSLAKGQKRTVFGKFGSGVAIITGDILLVQGLAKLHQASELVPEVQRKLLWNLAMDAVFEICTAETLGFQLRNSKFDLAPKDYYEVIKRKAVVPELATKIGAIIGNGDSESIEKLGRFGRTYGIVSLVAEEFIDLLDLNGLQCRLKNECPPLPLVYLLQNPDVKRAMLPILKAGIINKGAHEELIDEVLKSEEVKLLNKKLVSLISNELRELQNLPKLKMREELKTLLSGPLGFLDLSEPF